MRNKFLVESISHNRNRFNLKEWKFSELPSSYVICVGKTPLSPSLWTLKESRNQFRQAGNRFLGSLVYKYGLCWPTHFQQAYKMAAVDKGWKVDSYSTLHRRLDSLVPTQFQESIFPPRPKIPALFATETRLPTRSRICKRLWSPEIDFWTPWNINKFGLSFLRQSLG